MHNAEKGRQNVVLLQSHLTWCVIRTLHNSVLDPVEPDMQWRVPGSLRMIFVKILQIFTAQFLYMTNLTHNSFFIYVYSKSLHVSSTHVLIIRRINCVNTCGMSHYVGDRLVCRFEFHSYQHTRQLHRVTYTRCHSDTINP